MCKLDFSTTIKQHAITLTVFGKVVLVQVAWMNNEWLLFGKCDVQCQSIMCLSYVVYFWIITMMNIVQTTMMMCLMITISDAYTMGNLEMVSHKLVFLKKYQTIYLKIFYIVQEFFSRNWKKKNKNLTGGAEIWTYATKETVALN